MFEQQRQRCDIFEHQRLSDSSRALQRLHTAASTSATSVQSLDTSSPFIFFFNDAESRQRNLFSFSSDAVSVVVSSETAL
jgi:hypothetical protein